ncbi:hypothetical protein [Micromonospora carbonacea]|uniref:Uncharacterized protein n=1 Tax=Micromonospora carbonacea TaxID=47853 RepID=A0A1C5AAU8_9ACTN|nr:hypothetical protein [Micromonospora carbonacea]SCF42337.1 hypothetical protein GA0070563_11267 [Micromonospora carbonacea]
MADLSKIDHPLIATQQQTCWVCPDQWEGTLTNGSLFYYRYRSGWASLGIAAPGGEPAADPGEVGVAWGDPLQGAFDSDNDRTRVFTLLLRRRLNAEVARPPQR